MKTDKQFIRKIGGSRMVAFSLVAMLVSFSVSSGPAFAQAVMQENSSDLESEQKMQLLRAGLGYDQMAESVISALNKSFAKNSAKQCETEHRNTFINNTVKIYIGFGYQNGELSMVEDMIAQKTLRQVLLQNCDQERNPGIALCGFESLKRHGDDLILQKKIQMADGAMKKIMLTIASSSFTAYDYDNQNTFITEQNAKSQNARDQFFAAISTHDVVFYVGHSRDGGGPDFYPPQLLEKYRTERMVQGDQVDYSYYKQNPDGVNRLLAALLGGDRQPAVLGLFSCDSSGHFMSQLTPVLSPLTAVITTTRVTDKMFEGMLVGLNGVLSMQCRDQFAKVLKPFDGQLQKQPIGFGNN